MPVPAATPASAFFAPGEERLNGSEARIEGRTALRKSGDRKEKAYGWNQGGQAHPPVKCLGRHLGNRDSYSAGHWLLQRLRMQSGYAGD
jgi:hypothetical protein